MKILITGMNRCASSYIYKSLTKSLMLVGCDEPFNWSETKNFEYPWMKHGKYNMPDMCEHIFENADVVKHYIMQPWSDTNGLMSIYSDEVETEVSLGEKLAMQADHVIILVRNVDWIFSHYLATITGNWASRPDNGNVFGLTVGDARKWIHKWILVSSMSIALYDRLLQYNDPNSVTLFPYSEKSMPWDNLAARLGKQVQWEPFHNELKSYSEMFENYEEIVALTLCNGLSVN